MSRRRIQTIVEGRDPETFARNVRRARESLGWTRQRLCAEAGISPQTLAKVESGGACTPGVERKLADALGTVVGRLWERQQLQRQVVRDPRTDRWYFAGHADGERFHRSQALLESDKPVRYDPDAIQTAAERARMGLAGLASAFVRVTTGHLRAGSVISSLIELYGRMEAEIPEGRFAYFHVVRGAVRIQLRDECFDLVEGDVMHAEMSPGATAEPLRPVMPGGQPPLLAYVDVDVRRNRVPDDE